MSELRGARVLITGGAGFIGSHLAERLVADGATVVLFDNHRRDSLGAVPALAAHDGVRVVPGDVLDRDALTTAMRGVDSVLHLAAIAGVSSYYAEPLRTLEVNVLGTVNALEAARACGVRQFIDFSTSEVYGPDALWVDEESAHGIGPVSDQRWVYATSKLASEHFTLRFGEQYGMATACVRPFNIYGPRQTGEGAIGNFCRAAVRGEPLRVHGDGSAIRAWCYVTDVVDGVLRLMTTPEAAGRSYNLGNPREVETTLGLARRIVGLRPGARIELQEVHRSDVRVRIPVIERARSVLGFEPQVALDEGLTRTLAWFEEQQR